VETAVEALRLGAFDYLTKPIDLGRLKTLLARVKDTRELKQEVSSLRAELRDLGRFGNMVGTSPAMQRVYDLIDKVAPTEATAFLIGESGTGKELAARAIHHNSPRRSNRFVALNCSAIPETLLEAELFGHARGAFTGAVGTRQGRVEQAHKGTLFLDEVGTMSPSLQAKLLRVLQEREFERIGDSHTIKIDVRVIAATHSDLPRMVADSTFREDLYYRLNVLPVQLPPLRERREDIPLLIQHFLQRLSADSGRGTMTVSQEAMRRLMAYRWPGNVRQLENTVERALAFSQGRTSIDVQDLAPEIQNQAAAVEGSETWLPEDGIDFERYIEGIELSLIKRSLERTRGNKRQAARLLNLKRTTLIEKLKRLEPNQASE
jgi:DNA-binding NtrC family response regulator